MISLGCPGCGKQVKVKDELAGKKGKCPGCGQAITVPSLATNRGSPAVPEGVTKGEDKHATAAGVSVSVNLVQEPPKQGEGKPTGGTMTKVVVAVFTAIVAPIVVAVVIKWADPSIWRSTPATQTLPPATPLGPQSPTTAPDGKPPTGSADGFTRLFNGKDLTGWFVESGDARTWEAGDGELIARGQGLDMRNCLLTEGLYADFRLRVEFSVARGAASGIALRALRGETMGGHPFDHPNLLLMDGRTVIQGRGTKETGELHWVTNAADTAPSQSADLQPTWSWNRLEVEVKGSSLRAWVNGKQIASATLSGSARLPDGTIAALGRPRGRVGLQKLIGTARFRNIEIKELPPGPDAVAAEVPKPAKGFAAALREKDWGKWRVVEDCLEQVTLTESVWIAFGDKAWTDYDFSLELLRTRGNGAALAAFRTDWEKNADVRLPRGCVFGLGQWNNTAYTVESWLPDAKPWRLHVQKKAGLPGNTWLRARVSVRGAHVQCFLNDNKVFDCNIDKAHPTGGVGLHTVNTCYRFRNIKVTDPEGKVLLEGLPILDAAWSGK